MEKKLNLLLCMACMLLPLLFPESNLSAQNTFPATGSVGIGATTPAASSLLEVRSTTKGVLIPRMTQVQRNAIVSPAVGLLIFQTDAAPGFYYYRSGWFPIAANLNLSNLGTTTAINASLTPGATNTLTLGTAAKRWKNIYTYGVTFADGTSQSSAASNITLSNLKAATSINASLTPKVTNSLTLGTTAIRWKNIYTYGINFADGTAQSTAAANTTLSNLSATTSINANLLPKVNNSITLGSTTRRWKNIYTYAITFPDGTTQSTAAAPASQWKSSAGNIYLTTGSVGIGTSIGAPTDDYKLYVKGTTNGIYGTGTSYGIYGDGGSYGLYGNSENGFGGIAISANSDGFDAYTTAGFYGIYASCGNHTGVYGYGGATGTYGYGGTYGISGYSSGGYGVYGNSYNGYGVYGNTTSGYSAGYFHSVDGYGLGAASDNAGYAAVFFGGVYSSVGFFTSDRNLKKNTEDFSSAMSIINELKPKHYEFKTDAKYASLHLPRGKHYGLLAQDLEQILPDLVHEETFHIPINIDAQVIQPKTADGKDINQYTENTFPNKTEDINVKAVNYIELIPIMVKAMQEQNKIIREQNDKIELLTQKLKAMTNNNSINVRFPNAYLAQSIPNPVKNTATIHYDNIPANANAKLIMYDANGKILKQLILNSGSGSVNIDVSSLSAGIYSYSLMLNNTLAETKTMEVAR